MIIKSQSYLAAFFCLLAISWSLTANAQIFTMTNGASEVTCSGTFLDSGGTAGNYGNNENLVHTFCPDVVGTCMWLDFGSFLTQDQLLGTDDELNVYDGNSTAAPLLQTIKGDYGNFDFPVASSTGCITFEFTSNGNGNFAGWEAEIICVPCPRPQSVIEQDCINAIPVCQEAYFQPNTYAGEGNFPGEINDGFSCLDDSEENGVWYIFNPSTSGNLNFTIHPLAVSDDYDWGIWDITGATCQDIFPQNGLAPEVSCNYSNSNDGLGQPIDYGITGANSNPPYNGTGNSAPNTGDPHNASLPVTAGSTYVLYISNSDNATSQGGYYLDFRDSEAVLFDNDPPEIISMDYPACNDNVVYINLSEPVLCSSIDDTDIEIFNPTGLENYVATATGVGCINAGFTTQIELLIFPGIEITGNYNIVLVGSLEDNCGNIGTGSSFQLFIETVPMDAGTDFSFCAGTDPGATLGGTPTAVGTAPIMYNWTATPASALAYLTSTTASNPGFTDPTNIPPGVYTYIVAAEEALDCRNRDTVVVTVQSCTCTLTATPSASPVSCNGGTDGSLTLTSSGGVGALTYNWSNGATTATNPNLASGNYCYTVTDAANCTVTACANVPQPSIISFTTSTTAPSCSNNDASITVNNVAGGIPGYLYDFGAGFSGSNTANNLPAGNYTVSVMDANNCVQSQVVSLTSPTGPTLSNTVTDANCGACDGAVDLMVSGGSGPFTFNWEDAAMPGTIISTSEDISSLCAGDYCVTVTDAANCVVATCATIGSTNGPTIINFTTTEENCGMSNGTALVNLDMAGTYLYAWEDNFNPGSIISATNPATGLSSSTYTVTVTNTDGSCPAVASIGVSTTNSPTINTITATPATCGNSNGTATASISSGTPPYMLNWEDANNPNVTISTLNPLTGLAEGTYLLTVTDDVGCSSSSFVNITSNGGLTITATPTTPIVTCNGDMDGSIDLQVSGGTPPYDYNWDGPGGPYITQDLSGLGAGNYNVTVVDAIGCEGFASAGIIDPQPLIAAGNPTSPTCFGGSDGSITTFVFGGVPPYSFAWDNAPPVQNPTGLSAGNYILSVTDDNGCTETAMVVISDPAPFVATATATNASCAGGSDGTITLSLADGLPPYQFIWSNSSNQQDQTNLGQGSYTVTVTDDNGCTATASANITEPTAIGISVATQNISCTGITDGSIDLTVSGGVGTYTYSWNNAPSVEDPDNLAPGTYLVTVTDANACTATASAEIVDPGLVTISIDNVGDEFCGNANGTISISVTGGTIASDYNYSWSGIAPPQNSPTVTGLVTGTYFVNVTDDNGCTASASAAVGTASPTILANPTFIPVGCQNPTGGTITLTPTGGTAPYDYFWSNFGNVNPIENIPESTYGVLITDANGCTAYFDIPLGSKYISLGLAAATPASCANTNDGSLNLTAADGDAPYTYAWPHDPTLTTNVANGLAPGDYEVTLTDAEGCFDIETFTVEGPVAMLIETEVIENVTCFGTGNGIASAQAYGGQGPYDYLWPTSGETTGTAFALGGGIHEVVVTDANGCMATGTVEILESTSMSASATATDAACGLAEGSVTAFGMGGQTPYTYDWGALGMGQTINNVPPGTYTVVVTDAFGCQRNASVTVGGPVPVTPVVTTQAVTCFGGIDGTAFATVSGGAGGYTFEWDNGELSNPAIFLTAGTHTVTVTDQNNCPGIETFVVDGPAPFFPVVVVDPVSCQGGNDGTATINLSGGTAPYIYTWSSSPPQFSATANNLSAGVYFVSVVDDAGCEMNPIQVTVIEPAMALSVDLSQVVNLSCFESGDGSITASPLGGTPSYTYEWSTGATTSSLNNVGAGNYSVTITDLNGCTTIGAQTLTQPQQILFDVIAEDATCFGDLDGSIEIPPSPSGGNGTAYTYSLDGEAFQVDSLFQGLEAGDYTVYVSDIDGCIGSQTTFIGQNDEIILDAGVDATIQLGEGYQIETTVTPPSDSLVYAWFSEGLDSMSCIDCPNPFVMPTETTTYMVLAVDNFGCEAEDQITIEVEKDRRVFIPNAFTPNNDGINDVFMVYAGLGVSEVRVFRVFDRWGELLLDAQNVQPNDPGFGWDGNLKGKKMKPAVFVYYAEVLFADGEIREYKGDVTLLR